MDRLRKEVRETLVQHPGEVPQGLFRANVAASKSDLSQLWQDISSHDHSTHLDVSSFISDLDEAHYLDLREPRYSTHLSRVLGSAAAK